jgi:hypothetical protein
MARVGAKTLLHHLLHKFNQTNPTSLVNSGFFVTSITLQVQDNNLCIAWYFVNYKAKIEISYVPYYVKISLGCLQINIYLSSPKTIKLVMIRILHNNDEIIFTFEDFKDLEDEIGVAIKRNGHVGEQDTFQTDYRTRKYGLALRKIIQSDDLSETFMLLCEQLENITNDMIELYQLRR